MKKQRKNIWDKIISFVTQSKWPKQSKILIYSYTKWWDMKCIHQHVAMYEIIICIGPVHIGCGNCCLSSSMSTIVVIGVLFLMYHIAKCFAIQFFLQHSLFLLTIIRSFYCICHYSLLQKCCKTNVCRLSTNICFKKLCFTYLESKKSLLYTWVDTCYCSTKKKHRCQTFSLYTNCLFYT